MSWKVEHKTGEEIEYDDELDLRGEKCPDTFVYSKIKLEELAELGGGVLKIIVDYPPAVENIPRSLKDEKIKYEVLKINKKNKEYEIFVKAPALKE